MKKALSLAMASLLAASPLLSSAQPTDSSSNDLGQAIKNATTPARAPSDAGSKRYRIYSMQNGNMGPQDGPGPQGGPPQNVPDQQGGDDDNDQGDVNQ